MMAYIILIISFLLDGILSNFIPYMVGDLSLFSPLLTIVSLIIIYPLFKKNNKKYYIIAFITGILYDLFYTDLLFFNAFIFLLLAFFIVLLYKFIKVNFLTIILYTLVIITLYESVVGVVMIIFNVVSISIESLLYKIENSLLLNIVYSEVGYLLIKLFTKKNKNNSLKF